MFTLFATKHLTCLYMHSLTIYMMRGRTSPARDVDAVAGRLHSLTLHLLRRLRMEDEGLDLSPPRFSALSEVVRRGPVTVSELAAAEGVRPPTMTRLLDG